MSAKRTRNRRLELRVMFDTSVIYTGSASDLLRQEVANFSSANTGYPDLAVHCYIPEIVVHERQFQMLKKAQELLPSIEKLERVLGHNLAITFQLLEGRIKDVINEQIQERGLKIQKLDVSQVDWKRLVEDAAYRRLPFEIGETEKGFRDSIVLETFLQLVEESPATPAVCRVVLVAADKLLAEAADARMAGRSNVSVMRSLEELKGLISALVAQVDEHFIAKLIPKARDCFFEKGNETTRYYKEKLRERIKEKFRAELAALPSGATLQKEGTWFIAQPSFIKKEGQRIYWATRITIEKEATTYLSVPSTSHVTLGSFISPTGLTTGLGLGSGEGGAATTPGSGGGAGLGAGSLLASGSSIISGGLPMFGPLLGSEVSSSPLLAYSMSVPTERIIAKGKTVIEVVWSVSVSVKYRFSRPRIESMSFIETTWDT